MLAKVRENQACFGAKPEPVHTIGDGAMRFARCIGNYTSQSIYGVLAAYERYRSTGVLPYPGGLLDQPNKVLEAFDEIGAHDAEQAEAQQKKMEAVKRARGAKRGR